MMVYFLFQLHDRLEKNTHTILHERKVQPFCGVLTWEESRRRACAMSPLATGPLDPEMGALCFAGALENWVPSVGADLLPMRYRFGNGLFLLIKACKLAGDAECAVQNVLAVGFLQLAWSPCSQSESPCRRGGCRRHCRWVNCALSKLVVVFWVEQKYVLIYYQWWNLSCRVMVFFVFGECAEDVVYVVFFLVDLVD